MKGDPFGAADAKVAHVNQLINEVNSQTTSVDDLTNRVETLENAPAPTTEYYVNGRILQYDDGNGNPLFLFNVDSHNTPLVNIIDGAQHNTLQNLIGFGNAGLGIYSLYTAWPNNLLINTLDGEQSAYLSSYTMTSCVITPNNELYKRFSGTPKILAGISMDGTDFNIESEEGYFATIRTETITYNSVTQTLQSGVANIPTNGVNEFQARNILTVQLRFSLLNFVIN
jgi:hypothetical protein